MMLDTGLLAIIATLIECLEELRPVAPGHPSAQTIRVLATLRQFLREGTPWRSLRADTAQGQRRNPAALAHWLGAHRLAAQSARTVSCHAAFVAMLRGNPDLILDSCSVRARRGGDLTGPHPTDRARRGTKHHVATTANDIPDDIPLACIATAANVNDTVLFERLFLAAFRYGAHRERLRRQRP
jgi:hypothetical protein